MNPAVTPLRSLCGGGGFLLDRGERCRYVLKRLLLGVDAEKKLYQGRHKHESRRAEVAYKEDPGIARVDQTSVD